jgi:hypothetical protein
MLSSLTNLRIMNSKNTAIACMIFAALFIGIMAIMTNDSAYANSKNKGMSTQRERLR